MKTRSIETLMGPHNPGEQKAYSPIDAGGLRYLLYLPPELDPRSDKEWPVLCFLHGIGEAARTADGEAQSIYALLHHGTPPWHAQINSPLIRDFIVVAPQLPERRYWEGRDFSEITRILEAIYSRFRGDRARSYLTGFSIGGKAVFDFAAWGGTWAGLWPVDDANGEARGSCAVGRIWLHFGTWRPKPQSSSAESLGLQAAEPFLGQDPKGDRLFTDYRPFGYGHTETCVAAYSDWRVYRWMLDPLDQQ